MPVVTGWHHLAYPVSDIDAATSWYERVLGGTVVTRMGYSEIDVRAGRNQQVWIQTGDAVINIVKGTPVIRPPGGHFYHYALVADAPALDSWIGHLRSAGVDVFGPFGHGGSSALSLYFDDLDGYRLEIVFDFGDYESAKATALERGGALGNPDHSYTWE